MLNNFHSPFDELLKSTNSVTIHTKNLRLLMVEVYKSLNKLSPKLMQDTFCKKKSSYQLRVGLTLVIPQSNSTFSSNTFDFRAALAWNHLPEGLKNIPSLNVFINKLKSYNIYCKCKVCC